MILATSPVEELEEIADKLERMTRDSKVFKTDAIRVRTIYDKARAEGPQAAALHDSISYILSLEATARTTYKYNHEARDALNAASSLVARMREENKITKNYQSLLR